MKGTTIKGLPHRRHIYVASDIDGRFHYGFWDEAQLDGADGFPTEHHAAAALVWYGWELDEERKVSTYEREI